MLRRAIAPVSYALTLKLNGQLAAELMAKFVGPGSEVAMITGMLSAEEHRLKAEGFCAGFHGRLCQWEELRQS